MPAARVADRSPAAHSPMSRKAAVNAISANANASSSMNGSFSSIASSTPTAVTPTTITPVKRRQYHQQKYGHEQRREHGHRRDEHEHGRELEHELGHFLLPKEQSSSFISNKADEEEEEPKSAVPSPIKSEEQLKRERELCAMLVDQREQLEAALVQRLEELKKLCISEGELTGQLPMEIYKTLLPDEAEPQIKKRVGTAFKFSQELIEQQQEACDDAGRLEAEIQFNRRIVAAAERLANDRSANKSVRKKRRKDFQAATLRLRSLEKGLSRMRLSSSKPDVSSMQTDSNSLASGTIGHQSRANAGSGFSLNSLKHWPNWYNSMRLASAVSSSTTKSCPPTPRGSIPDLMSASTVLPAPAAGSSRKQTPTTTKKLHNLLKGKQQQQQAAIISSSSSSSTNTDSACCVSTSSSLSLNGAGGGSSPKAGGGTISATTSTSSGISSASANGGTRPSLPPSSLNSSMSSASNLLLTAPPVPIRRSSAGSYANSGCAVERRPTPPRQRRSASRDCSFGTDVSNSRSREQLAGTHLYANIGYTSSAPYKSAYRQSNFPTLHVGSSPSSEAQSPASSAGMPTKFATFHTEEEVMAQRRQRSSRQQQQQQQHAITEAASNQLGHIVRQLDSSASLLCRPIPMSHTAGGGPSSYSSSALPRAAAPPRFISCYSTGSLDRRAMRTVKTTTTSTSSSRFVTCASSTGKPPLTMTGGQSSQFDDRRPEPDHFDVSNADGQNSAQLLNSTTFPVNDTFRPLESADFARYRSISAILDRQRKIATSSRQKQLPSKDERMEALLASIQEQQQLTLTPTTPTPQQNGTTTPSTTTVV